MLWIRESFNGRRTGRQREVAYPFSSTGASIWHRVHAHVVRQQIRTTTISQRSGRVLDDQTVTTPLAASLNMSSVSTALITDSSLFGATSPVAGRRSRFEVSPTFGDIQMTTALADYRHYFMPARFYTIAVRGMHYGRYGAGGDDERLVPLFIGYPEFVRGYGIDSFSSEDCGTSTTCSTFDRLVGSRMLVGNIELRFPLLRPFGVSDACMAASSRSRVLPRRWRDVEERSKAVVLQRRHPRTRQ